VRSRSTTRLKPRQNVPELSSINSSFAVAHGWSSVVVQVGGPARLWLKKYRAPTRLIRRSASHLKLTSASVDRRSKSIYFPVHLTFLSRLQSHSSCCRRTNSSATCGSRCCWFRQLSLPSEQMLTTGCVDLLF
jgi:hypothetical protein